MAYTRQNALNFLFKMRIFSPSANRQPVNVIAILREDRTDVFTYTNDTESRQKLFAILSKRAKDPDDPFTWYDAAIVSGKIRELTKQCFDDNGWRLRAA